MVHVLHLGLSYACNMKCRHCFVDKSKDRLSDRQIAQALDTLVNQYGLFIVYYTYGEPLLASNFSQITELCSRHDLVQILMTNGSLIDDSVCQLLKQNGVAQVFVSIDSASEGAHDQNRGMEGAFAKAMAAISVLRSHGIRTGVATTVTEENCAEVFDIWRMVSDLGINAFSLLRARHGSTLSVLPQENSYFAFVEWYLKNCEHIPVNLHVHDPSLIPIIEKLRKNGHISPQTYEKYRTMNTCHADTTLALAPNGDVSRCNLVSNVIGNLNSIGIAEILDMEASNHERTSCVAQLSRAGQ